MPEKVARGGTVAPSTILQIFEPTLVTASTPPHDPRPLQNFLKISALDNAPPKPNTWTRESAEAPDMPSPLDTYHYRRQKGALPPLGTIGAILNTLPPTLRERLLASIQPHDRALSDTVARLIERALLDPRR
jgi:hypothetical protein